VGLAAVLLAVLALAQAAPCPECRVQSKRVMLCTLHATEETSVLRDVRAVLSKGGEAERIAALERAASLTAAHPQAASPGVARLLSGSVGDVSLRVRTKALALLCEGQNHEEAVRGVLDGWKEAQKTWRVLDAKLVLGESASAEGIPVTLTTEELQETPDYFVEALRALGQLGDERAVTALVTFLRSPLDRTPGRFLVAASEAALELDSRRGVRGVISLLEPRRSVRRWPGAEAFEARGRTLAALKQPLEPATCGDGRRSGSTHRARVATLGRATRPRTAPVGNGAREPSPSAFPRAESSWRNEDTNSQDADCAVAWRRRAARP
jgi:hypothetical protein